MVLLPSPSSPPWLSQAQVEHLDHALWRQQQILRLHVAVDQAALEGVLQPQRRLPGVGAGQVNGQRAFLLDQPAEVGPLDEFHDEEVGAAGLVRVVGVDDVRVVELGGGADLAVETPHRVGVAQPLLADQLQRHHAAELPVAGLEHLAHAALAETIHEDVGAKEEARAAALEQLVSLVGSEPPPADQMGGQRTRIGEARQQAAGKLLELGRLQQLAEAEGVQQIGGGLDGHHDHLTGTR
jgi:hypothetical protein